tara:strand:- start:276 stop:470 length:195 start_codon:yes stop_codon:yes gene_type:complete
MANKLGEYWGYFYVEGEESPIAQRMTHRLHKGDTVILPSDIPYLITAIHWNFENGSFTYWLEKL